jgi:hypothetical protein
LQFESVQIRTINKEYHHENQTDLRPRASGGGAAAVAIVAAPTAAALPKICAANGAGTTCQSPGNVEITNSAPAVSFYPYGTMPYLLGDH